MSSARSLCCKLFAPVKTAAGVAPQAAGVRGVVFAFKVIVMIEAFQLPCRSLCQRPIRAAV